jgi:glycosyltransferase involved in cell wall biosynthesis
VHSKKNWPLPSKVIYPPVEIDQELIGQKKNIILSVGRFFGYLREKKHQMMIETFSALREEGKLKGWDLYLAGSMGEGDKAYVDELKAMASGLSVMILPNIAHEDLKHLYGMSKIYWHAMGYQEEDPTKMEHFGITTVEAMAAGAGVVIGGNNPGYVSVLENDETIFDPLNTEELTSLLKKLVAEEGLRAQLHARQQKLIRKYDVYDVAPKILKIYTDCIASKESR